MRNQPTFSECVALAEHYIAIGMTEIHLYRNDDDFPWHLVTDVVAGGACRLNGPSDARCVAKHESGLMFSWYFEFEEREANGAGVNQFSADKMLGAARKLPQAAREQFAALLRDEVWSGVRKHTDDIREALRKQEASLGVLQAIMVSVGHEVAA